MLRYLWGIPWSSCTFYSCEFRCTEILERREEENYERFVQSKRILLRCIFNFLHGLIFLLFNAHKLWMSLITVKTSSALNFSWTWIFALQFSVFSDLLMREAHEKCVKRWPGLLVLFIVTPKVVLSLDFFLVRCHSEVSEFVVVKNQPSPAG